VAFSIEDGLIHAQKLADRGESGKARQLYQIVLERDPENVRAREALTGLENRSAQLNALSGLLEKGDFSAVIEQGECLTAQFPASVILHNILGIAYANLEQHDPASRHFLNALSVRPDMAALHVNLGKSLSSLGRNEDAIASFLNAIRLKPDYADAHFSLGVLLGSMRRHQESADCFFQALKLRPKFADAEVNLGNALRELDRLEEAIVCFQRAIALEPSNVEAYVHLATTYNQQKNYSEAITALDTILRIAPDRSDAHGLRLFLAAVLCDWDTLQRDAAVIPALGLSGKPVQPFMLLPLEDDPARHRLRAERLTAERCTLPELGPISRPASRPERLRLGYFSADFYDHPVMQQLIRALELHDRDAFEISAYSYGPPADDVMRRRVRKAVHNFRDVRNLSAKEIAQLARQDNIDIAIDLMGHTRSGRPEIFAYRAAPVQITWLGYPGTVGGAFMDYMIADRTIIPDEQRPHYAEKIIFMPQSYFPTDNTRPIADAAPARRDMGLPETGFVFCCLNNSYKFSAAEFDIWMRLLRQVDDSVLWLAGSNDLAQRNLTQEAVKRGVDPARVIFTGRIGMAEHLARQRLAGLFLDTFQYNGHSTAADALWAGLPVITCSGKGFPSRVAASLLNAIGLPELVAETREDYEHLALDLARNPDRLAAIKDRLDDNRLRTPLFDPERFTENLEAGYRQAYEQFLAGGPQGDIIVKS